MTVFGVTGAWWILIFAYPGLALLVGLPVWAAWTWLHTPSGDGPLRQWLRRAMARRAEASGRG